MVENPDQELTLQVSRSEQSSLQQTSIPDCANRRDVLEAAFRMLAV
jgi:hypothetical protein